MATEQEMNAVPVENDPIEKLYRNAKKKLDVGTLDNFKRLLSGKDSRQSIYDDLVQAYGPDVKTRIGNDVNEFNSRFGGQKKNQFITRFNYWWTYYFRPCCSRIGWVIFG